MYQKAYGIIETLAPLHIGASAGEETGNLNLIFRDQFTQTGIIPGSSIRGRFRADMRQEEKADDKSKQKHEKETQETPSNESGEKNEKLPKEKVSLVEYWYGKDAKPGLPDSTSEGLVKIEYASILWLPIYCPSQPVVLVTCPALLKRYQKIAGKPIQTIEPYSYYVPDSIKKPVRSALFFNLGCLPLKKAEAKLEEYITKEIESIQEYLVLVVKDTEMATIHDMGLYRQSRVALKEEQKTVAGTSFFNVEALPEGTILVFPIALRTSNADDNPWNKFIQDSKINLCKELYFGGLESVGFGRTNVILKKP
ncbi:RAMP superfamily CRISPR-associated protein [Scytonema sp. NUACC26]|uniref:RAMP superfamily CRISPR-associated protein n=1 Tax=Scytonema sp. NUACC26 TaxID=3140176 RepID=UPI0034DC0025